MMTEESPKATHRGPKAPSIELDESSRDELNRLLKRHLTPQQIALRARIVVEDRLEDALRGVPEDVERETVTLE